MSTALKCDGCGVLYETGGVRVDIRNSHEFLSMYTYTTAKDFCAPCVDKNPLLRTLTAPQPGVAKLVTEAEVAARCKSKHRPTWRCWLGL